MTLRSLERERDAAKTQEGRAEVEAKIVVYRAERRKPYEEYLAALSAWEESDELRKAEDWLGTVISDLEFRGLLQFDHEAQAFDMHPAIRNCAIAGLTPEAKGKTGAHVADFLSSQPLLRPIDESNSLEDFGATIGQVQALHLAGKFEEAYAVYTKSGLASALFRLEYFHEELRLMRPYFPSGWERGPGLLAKENQRFVISKTAVALARTGQRSRALKIYELAIERDLSSGELGEACTDIGNYANSINILGQFARAVRLRRLAKRLAELHGRDHNLLWCGLQDANDILEMGDVVKAASVVAELSSRVVADRVSTLTKAWHALLEFKLKLYTGQLIEPDATDILQNLRSLQERVVLRLALKLVGIWRQSRGDHYGAIEVFNEAIALANEIGTPQRPGIEALRGVSLIALGQHDRARRIAEESDGDGEELHHPLAKLFLALGEHAKARHHALAGYKKAWADGPPYYHHWDLTDCREVLATLGEQEPKLPQFDEKTIKPFDFEPAVEQLITETAAKMAKAAEEKAQGGAEREAAIQARTEAQTTKYAASAISEQATTKSTATAVMPAQLVPPAPIPEPTSPKRIGHFDDTLLPPVANPPVRQRALAPALARTSHQWHWWFAVSVLAGATVTLVTLAGFADLPALAYDFVLKIVR